MCSRACVRRARGPGAQTRHVVHRLGPDEYDAALAAEPHLDALRLFRGALGPAPPGRALLDGAAADAERHALAALARGDEGRALLGRVAGAVGAAFAPALAALGPPPG